MAIKIQCQTCGFQNELGRVFCVQCGKRLELTNTSLEDLAQRRQIEWGPIVRRILGWLAVLLVAAVMGAAFWRQPVGTILSDPSGPQQIATKTRALQHALRARQRVSLTLGEAEVNGFLEARAKSRGVEHLAIDLRPGGFELSAWHRWMPVTNVNVLTNLVIPVSCELSCAFEGKTCVVKGGRLGHIPLPGAVAVLTAPWYQGWFDDVLAQTNLLAALQGVTIEDGTAQLVFGP